MIIIETSLFTKKITALLSDEEYRILQNDLLECLVQGVLFKAVAAFAKYDVVAVAEEKEAECE